jgi:hypothetical protein
MNTRISILLSLVVWLSASAAWSQDVPLPLPPPAVGTALPPPPPPPPPLDALPGTLAPAAPSQPPPVPYYVYPAPGPYAAPVVVSPPAMELVPLPPLPPYVWSAAVDALFLERSSGGSILLGATLYNSAAQLPPRDSLYSDDAGFPLAAGMRLEISGKLDNDITLAATYWGLQQWSVGSTIYADPYQDTVLAYSPYLQLPTLLNGLDNWLGYTSSSQIDNVELNALFRLSSYNPYWQLNWLWGARYIYFADQFTLSGVDTLNSASEQLAYSTTNNLIGGQTGLLFTYGWSRFQWEAGLKVALMANIYRQHGTDTASEPSGIPAGFIPYDISNSGCGLSALFELSLAARYRLTDNLWLRLGYQFYDIGGLALAPRQLDAFGHGGNVALDGFSLGLQGTW